MDAVHGLAYPFDIDALDVLQQRPAPHAPIRALSAQQFALLHQAHAVVDPPDSVLFPFLHGLESSNEQQKAFFAKPALVPRYRGLVWVVADDSDDRVHDDAMDQDDHDDEDDSSDEDELFADHPHDASEHGRSLSPAASTSSTSSLDESWSGVSASTSITSMHSLCNSSSSLPNFTPGPHLLTSTFFPSELLSNSTDGPVFTPPKVPDGVSLRNFGIQAPIYATLSDIVVYSPKGACPATIAVAERFKHAIEAKLDERSSHMHPDQPPLLSYNVFVVTDPFMAFEERFSSLVAISSSGNPTPNYPDLASREKEEMRVLTRASEILSGAWLGNSADVPVWHPGDSDDPCCSLNNPAGYDICVECHDGAPFPTGAHLRQAEDHLGAMDALWATGFGANVSAGLLATSSAARGAPPRPAPNANAVVHLSCPSSPLSNQSAVAQLLALIDFLNRAVRGATPASPFSLATASRPVCQRPLKILLHSADGYTDSSVLALCLIMAQKHCSLPEAYLELQVGRSRSFFVFQTDLPFLKRVEAKLSPPSPPLSERKRDREKSAERSRERWGWTFSRSSSGASVDRSNSLPALSTSAPSTPAPIALSTSPPPPSTPPPSSPTPRRARASTSAAVSPLNSHHSWFNDPRFDGSFPSRVLPFLYLGNLNHASNAYMLHALGITHVVSVGECALVPPPAFPPNAGPAAGAPGARVGSFAPGSGPHQHGSLWIEEREGRIKVLDIKGVCDDGIDSLRGQFEPICDWIDKARTEGGRVLIHCRVGVSRSATVTIAYVMRHLNLSLIDAYLIVRSRRLSVLIQPNMRLLYNLCGWEKELAIAKVDAALAAHTNSGEDRASLVRDKLSRSLTWPYLAREVHLLNEKYLA